MLSSFPVGKLLTAIKVFEPWRGENPDPDIPLFGALVIEFEDIAVLFKSPLRYCRSTQGSQITLTDGRRVDLGFRVDCGDPEEIEARCHGFDNPIINPLGLNWQSVFSPSYGRGFDRHAWRSIREVAKVAGQRLHAVSLAENQRRLRGNSSSAPISVAAELNLSCSSRDERAFSLSSVFFR